MGQRPTEHQIHEYANMQENFIWADSGHDLPWDFMGHENFKKFISQSH